jgi:hypothetical protein
MLVFWTLRKADKKYLESFKIWSRRKMGKNSLADRVSDEEVLHRVKEGRNSLHTIKKEG